MSAKLVKLDKAKQDDSRLIEYFKRCLDRARNGEINGAIVILDLRDNVFDHSRVNMDLLTAMALLNRALYRANTEWDDL